MKIGLAITCSEADCVAPAKARGLCIYHYNRHHLAGTLPPKPGSWEKFMARVVVDEEGCWIWQGKRTAKGYALFYVDKQIRPAYRWAYEYLHGVTVDSDLVMDHFACHRDSSGCANPHHVRPETRSRNAADSAWSRKTHCPQGHPYDEANTARWVTGGRRCRKCLSEKNRRWYENTEKARRAARKAQK